MNKYKFEVQEFVSEIDGMVHYTEKALEDYDGKLREIQKKRIALMPKDEANKESMKMDTQKQIYEINKERRKKLQENKLDLNYNNLEDFTVWKYVKDVFDTTTPPIGWQMRDNSVKKNEINNEADEKIKEINCKLQEVIDNNNAKSNEKKATSLKASTPKPKKEDKFVPIHDKLLDPKPNAEEVSTPIVIDINNLGEKSDPMGVNMIGGTVHKADNKQDHKYKNPGTTVKQKNSNTAIAPDSASISQNAPEKPQQAPIENLFNVQQSEEAHNAIMAFYGEHEVAAETLADTIKKTNEKIEKSDEETKKSSKEKFQELHDTMQTNIGYMQEAMGSLSTIANTLWQDQLQEMNEQFNALNEQYNKAVEDRKASDDKLQELESQAANARGGRSLVIQEQIDREMAKNQQLAQQEKNLAKEKEKAEKEIAKKEKQMKKAEMGQNIMMGIANVALSVTKALAAGPLIGQILAGLAAAAGAVQVAVMTKPWARPCYAQ